MEPQAPVEILFRLERREEQLDPLLPRLTLYADGRLLTWDALQDDLAVRTLSAAGIDAFLAEVLTSGSFAESHGVASDPLPGSSIDPFTVGIGVDEFSLFPPDGPTIKVTTETTSNPVLFARSPERDALMALADRLIAADWLPAGSWVDATPSRYVPGAYLLLSGSTVFPPDMPICPPPNTAGGPCGGDVANVDWPLVLPPDGIGPGFIPADGMEDSVDHCLVIGRAFADALAATMQHGGLGRHLYVTTRVAWREQNSFYELRLRPLLPEESATCAGKSVFPAQGIML